MILKVLNYVYYPVNWISGNVVSYQFRVRLPALPLYFCLVVNNSSLCMNWLILCFCSFSVSFCLLLSLPEALCGPQVRGGPPTLPYSWNSFKFPRYRAFARNFLVTEKNKGKRTNIYIYIYIYIYILNALLDMY